MELHSIKMKNRNSSSSKKKYLSSMVLTPQIELGCALCSDQGIKLSGKVPFVTFEQPVEELPSFQAQTKDSHIS